MNTIDYNHALAHIDRLTKQAQSLDREQQRHLADAIQKLLTAMYR